MMAPLPRLLRTPWVLAICALICDDGLAQQVGGHWERLERKEGRDYYGLFGGSVSGIGDLDGDGVRDFLVGQPRNSLISGAVYVYSGADRSLIRRLDGPIPGDRFGASVADAGDVDGDGVQDIVVGAPALLNPPVNHPGSVYVYSGADGTLLHEFHGTHADIRFGVSVDGAGDVDADGHADIVIGAPESHAHFGAVYVYSGGTGLLLRRIDGIWRSLLGASVAGAGDIDADGHDDILIGIPGDASSLQLPGSAAILSGRDGSTIRRYFGTAWGESFGYSVASAGDVDGDGVPDQVIGLPGFGIGQTYGGAADVYSGATGVRLHRFQGTFYAGIGKSVASAGDVDGDGHDDLLIGAPNTPNFSGQHVGSLLVYSGGNGELLVKLDARASTGNFGAAAAGLGDLDGDRVPEILVGSPAERIGTLYAAGSFEIHSLDPYLYVAETSISYSASSPVALELAFPTTEAGCRYAILLSVSGPGPSSFGGIAVPVTLDAAFFAVLGRPSMLGNLNWNARATHSFSIPRRAPAGAIGHTLCIAAVTFSPGSGLGRLSSAVRYLDVTH